MDTCAVQRSTTTLASLSPGFRGQVVRVGGAGPVGPRSALERRLLELGFIEGEPFEVVAETRPGRDPFVVRIGQTTLAMRRREAETVWVTAGAPAGP